MGSKPIGISASRSSAIMGLNPLQTEFEVWQQMIEEKYPGYNADHGYEMPEDISDKPAIRWGTAFESAIIELAENKAGEKIAGRERFYKKQKYITCHIDGYYVKYIHEGLVLHEGKTTSYFYFKDNFGEPGTDKVPVSYQSQAQHQLLCTGADKVIMSVLIFPKRVEEWETEGFTIDFDGNKYYIFHPNKDLMNRLEKWAYTMADMGYFHQYIIERNEDTQKAMLDYYKEWWEKHIIKKQPPEPSNYKDIQRLWTAPVGTIIATEQLERWCVEYKDITSELGTSGALNKRKNELKVLILKHMKNMDNMIDDDSRTKTILRNTEGKKLISYNGKTFR